MAYRCQDCKFETTLDAEAAKHHHALKHRIQYKSEIDGNWHDAFSD